MMTLRPFASPTAAIAAAGLAAALAARPAAAVTPAAPTTRADGAGVTLPPPRLAYTSAFRTAPSSADPADPAAIDWAQSNALVGALRGHAGHLRGRAGDPPPAPGAAAPAGHRHRAAQATR